MASSHDEEKNMSAPLVVKHKVAYSEVSRNYDSLFMVLLSTFVAVCGSFGSGVIIGYSAPTQSAITSELGLSLSGPFNKSLQNILPMMDFAEAKTMIRMHEIQITKVKTEMLTLMSHNPLHLHELIGCWSSILSYGALESMFSVLGSIANIGAMVGALTSGYIADYIGRKGGMWVSSFFFLAGWLAVYYAQGAILLDIGRLSGGYGMGLISYAAPVFISEISPKNLRGLLTTLNQTLLITGVSSTFIIGTIISWRTLTLVGIIPCFVLFFGLFFIPESPRWLAKVGHQKKFELSLRKLRGKDADISDESAEIQEYIDTLQHLPKAQIMDLFQRRYLLSVTIGVGLMLIQQLGGIKGIAFYVSHIFETAGFNAKIGTIIYAVIQVPINGSFLVDRAGRRFLLIISASGLVLGSLLIGSSFFMKAHELFLDLVPILVLMGMLVYISFFSIGMGSVPWVIMSEVLPINIKVTAGSLITVTNWIASWIVSLSFNFLMSWSSSGTFFLFAAINAVGVVFIAKLVPETKGRTLEEIQASISS